MNSEQILKLTEECIEPPTTFLPHLFKDGHQLVLVDIPGHLANEDLAPLLRGGPVPVGRGAAVDALPVALYQVVVGALGQVKQLLVVVTVPGRVGGGGDRGRVEALAGDHGLQLGVVVAARAAAAAGAPAAAVGVRGGGWEAGVAVLKWEEAVDVILKQ